MKYNWPLSDCEISRLYWELEKRGGFCTGDKTDWSYSGLSEEELFALAIGQSRYDPQLLAILIDLLRKPIPVDPVRFKEELRATDLLSVVAAMGEFILEMNPEGVARDLLQFLRVGVQPVPTQLFFKCLYPVGGRKMEEVTTKPVWTFKKWGFLLSDPPLLKDRRPFQRIYLYDSASRHGILKGLLKEKKRIRIKDYLKEIDYSISRQQALKDLSGFHGVARRGKGKGRYYLLLPDTKL